MGWAQAVILHPSILREKFRQSPNWDAKLYAKMMPTFKKSPENNEMTNTFKNRILSVENN